MAFCANCGKELSGDAAFCPYCGTQTEQSHSPEIKGSEVGEPQSGGSNDIQSEILSLNDIIMKKKILSMLERYDFEDRQGQKLGEG
jgi:uncharacterized membrane protein YvbJ